MTHADLKLGVLDSIRKRFLEPRFGLYFRDLYSLYSELETAIRFHGHLRDFGPRQPKVFHTMLNKRLYSSVVYSRGGAIHSRGRGGRSDGKTAYAAIKEYCGLMTRIWVDFLVLLLLWTVYVTFVQPRGVIFVESEQPIFDPATLTPRSRKSRHEGVFSP